VFGPIVVAGLGGILAEVVRDVALALVPVHPEEARAMLADGARGRLLAGARGRPACDLAPLVAALIGIGGLMAAVPRAIEIDVNPVIAAGARAIGVDAVVILGDETRGGT